MNYKVSYKVGNHCLHTDDILNTRRVLFLSSSFAFQIAYLSLKFKLNPSSSINSVISSSSSRLSLLVLPPPLDGKAMAFAISSLLPAFEEDFDEEDFADFDDLVPLHILSKSVFGGTRTMSMVWRMPVHCREIATSCKLENCLAKSRYHVRIRKRYGYSPF